MELDLSSLWSWTIPLWGLFLIVLLLAGILSEPLVFQELPQRGGSKRVRFSLTGLK
jgi:hypothetical protein